jgi:hypothetical protein
MATGLHLKAAGRAGRFTAAIRDLLLSADTNGGLTEACRRLRAEAAKTRRQRPNDGPLAEADVAGIVAALAVLMHTYKPPRPAGCPRQPRPEDLLAVFAASFERTLTEAGDE